MFITIAMKIWDRKIVRKRNIVAAPRRAHHPASSAPRKPPRIHTTVGVVHFTCVLWHFPEFLGNNYHFAMFSFSVVPSVHGLHKRLFLLYAHVLPGSRLVFLSSSGPVEHV
jgi:hypothetical protein